MIGGWAAIVHGVPRLTLDVDLYIRPTLVNAERLVEALSQVGFGIAKELSASEILGRGVFQFSDQIRVDLFTKPWGLDEFEACRKRAIETHFDGTIIPVLGFDDLVASKRTGRPQDEADLAALKELRGE